MALLRTRGFPPSSHSTACRHLSRVDPILATLIARTGPCRLVPRRDAFTTLCDSIIAQQLSAAAATTIFNRFAALFPRRRPTPQALAGTSVSLLARAGVSPQKIGYLKDLARAFLTGRIQPRRFRQQVNEAIIAELIAVKGIGRWTAEMFLIFALNRLDVLPVDDLGIRKAVRAQYALRQLPSPSRLRRLAKGWHPYETIACWYLWHSTTAAVQDRGTGGPKRRAS